MMTRALLHDRRRTHAGPRLLLLPALYLALTACATAAPTPGIGSAPAPPPVEREFRGVWIASVDNIDWPSEPGLPVDRQKAELVAMLDRAVELRLNAVILQVRPAADALYHSELEPWSEYLTGAMGRAPEPFYDPLAFAVEEAHRRGLELHAWFNPYRARHPSATSAISAGHISRTRPELVRTYGTHLWMDPGEAAVQDHTVAVILDVVRRYDVDGVHIDDYFYPYREAGPDGALLDFPDSASWTRYRAAGGRLARNDWRRDNVDRLVERLYQEIKREKRWVQFGISPFGVWRPGHPRQIQGFDAYDQLYADARRWLMEGWVDYFTPQLYWPIAQTRLSYPVLLDWWASQNSAGRHLWPGNFTSRLAYGARPFWRTDEILGQIYVTRGHPGATGNVHFSMRIFMENPDSLGERLRGEAYPAPALVPASPWLGGAAPPTPRVAASAAPGGGVRLALGDGNAKGVWLWTVRVWDGSAWSTRVVPGAARMVELDGAPGEAWVTAVGRTGAESRPAVVRLGGDRNPVSDRRVEPRSRATRPNPSLDPR